MTREKEEAVWHLEDSDVVSSKDDFRTTGHRSGDSGDSCDACGEQGSGSCSKSLQKDIFCLVSYEERIAVGPNHGASGLRQGHLPLQFKGACCSVP